VPEPGPAAPGSDGPQHGTGLLQERLREHAAALAAGGEWAGWLATAARMPGESFANVLLIHAASPAATLTRGYQQWREAGRQVRRGEPGTAVFALPAPAARPPWLADRAASPVPWHPPSWRDAGRVRTVWDITQTDGAPVTVRQPAPATAQTAPALLEALSWLARRAGYAVTGASPAPEAGTTDQRARQITIAPGTGPDSARALAHQLAHLLLHGGPPAPPGPAGGCCTGARRAEAGSVAYLICARYGLPAGNQFTRTAAWAGTDPRARPADAVIAAGEHITAAAARITSYLDPVMPARETTLGGGSRPAPAAPPPAPPPPARPAPAPAVTPARLKRVLADAQAFFTAALPGSWAQDYLRSRQIPAQAAARWGIGRAPPGWTALTDHLRQLSHDDQDIQDAGLARTCRRGTLIDVFRDRVTLPVHAPGGTVAGFTARARPGAPPGVPKYLNSPATAAYSKGALLFGLHQARDLLAAGAIPVITEGPFDAIAVTVSGQDRFAGLAPCGTALTSQQASLLASAADLPSAGVITAFDSDAAGRKAAVRAHGILRPFTGKLQTLTLDGKDPAEILQRDGAGALAAALHGRLMPLSAVIIDASIDPWRHRLSDIEGPLLALRAAARTIAALMPPAARDQIRQITGNRELRTTDDMDGPAEIPGLGAITALIPADTAYQMVRTATQLGTDLTDVLTETASVIAATPEQPPPSAAAASFPRPPLASQARPPGTAPAHRRPAAAGNLGPRRPALPMGKAPGQGSARRHFP
jgi:DNA primase